MTTGARKQGGLMLRIRQKPVSNRSCRQWIMSCELHLQLRRRPVKHSSSVHFATREALSLTRSLAHSLTRAGRRRRLARCQDHNSHSPSKRLLRRLTPCHEYWPSSPWKRQPANQSPSDSSRPQRHLSRKLVQHARIHTLIFSLLFASSFLCNQILAHTAENRRQIHVAVTLFLSSSPSSVATMEHHRVQRQELASAFSAALHSNIAESWLTLEHLLTRLAPPASGWDPQVRWSRLTRP